jgi:MFS family permease
MPRSAWLLAALRARLAPWRAVLPVLVAEFVVWLGFGALLPVMPLYFRQRGIDLVGLGIVVAAWPAARLLGEPLFGLLADRWGRRKPFMVAGLAAAGLFMALPLVVGGLVAFVACRALAGLAAAAYDPAARGTLVGAGGTREGELFGVYGAVQTAGLLVGPAVGGATAALTGDPASAFLVAAAAALIAAAALALLVREPATVQLGGGSAGWGPALRTELPLDDPVVLGWAADDLARPGGDRGAHPRALTNRLLVAALVINLGNAYAGGTYEVVWSLWLTSLGAGLDFIGLTFVLFALPMLVVSPFAGRLVDRGAGTPAILFGSLATSAAGLLYGLIRDPLLVLPISVFESVGFSFLSPALYRLVALGTPAGRASTAQGLFGAAGTLGFIVASLTAGLLAGIDLRLPLFTFAAVSVVALLVGLAVGGPLLWRAQRGQWPGRPADRKPVPATRPAGLAGEPEGPPGLPGPPGRTSAAADDPPAARDAAGDRPAGLPGD